MGRLRRPITYPPIRMMKSDFFNTLKPKVRRYEWAIPHITEWLLLLQPLLKKLQIRVLSRL